ncbi:MAG: aldo/keto reductase [Lachnospiraceae bacterium]|nr:aldo/keto reductase [Lachnospiraceae bacterium]
MQYRKDKKGNDISALGFGCMRFTKKGNSIDIDKAEKEVMAAIEAGVNYYDTAYIYPGSEVAVGEILHRNQCREKVKIATKLPHYMIKSMEGVEKTFQEELKRLQTDYIDYYLMHMLTDIDTWNKLVKLGMKDWIEKKLASGAIRNIGFSYHGKTDKFIELIDAYDWDFCQIQYNYMDEHSQAGVAGLKYANEKGIPVIIMEPLRGGRLVDLLPESAKEIFAQDKQGRTAAEMAFKWLYNQPEVTCVLSGMNSLKMVEENVKTASETLPESFTEADYQLIDQVKNEIQKSVKVGCTGCGYCMPCPMGVDIPGTFRCYNAMYSEGKSSGRRDYLQCTTFRKNPSSASQCVACGKCETHCPQHIEIRKELKNASKDLETISYKIVKKAIQLLKLWG